MPHLPARGGARLSRHPACDAARVVPPAWLRAILRRGCWLAYRVLRLWWRLRRPEHHGAVVAAWHEGRILLVADSYRGRWGWPGGGIRKGELPIEAARRELAEELGLVVAYEALRFVGEVLERWERRRDYVRIFELILREPQALAPDGVEIVAAAFLSPAAALELPLVPFVRAYLEAGHTGSPAPPSA
ncbi:MAG TPA: NUDIX hydrolase [Alphaproteobacteria bacterium]|nr:NUDIX hydrolase [Alphaproteobacteria bacterium]